VRKILFNLQLWQPRPQRHNLQETYSNTDATHPLPDTQPAEPRDRRDNSDKKPGLDRPSKPETCINAAFNTTEFQTRPEMHARKRKPSDRRLKVATLNVATLRNKLEELIELMKVHKFTKTTHGLCEDHDGSSQRPIMGLCETRMKGNGRSIVHDDFVLLHSGTDTTRHGVAFLVTPEIGDKISDVQYVNERMMGMSVKVGNSYIDLVQVYAPQQGRPLDEKEAFYEELQDLADKMPHRQNLMIIGDLNGHVGNDRQGCETVIGGFGIGGRNEEGEKIIDFCIRNQLAVMNTFFMHQETHK